jgi:hypothetical protein
MGAIFPEVNRPERKADYSSTVMWRLGVKRAVTALPQYALMACIETNVLCLKKPVINHLTVLIVSSHRIASTTGSVTVSYFVEIVYITIVVAVIIYYTVTLLYCIGAVVSVSLSLCNGASSGCRWRMAFNTEGSCGYIE